MFNVEVNIFYFHEFEGRNHEFESHSEGMTTKASKVMLLPQRFARQRNVTVHVVS